MQRSDCCRFDANIRVNFVTEFSHELLEIGGIDDGVSQNGDDWEPVLHH